MKKKNKVKKPPINWWNRVCQREEKKNWVEKRKMLKWQSHAGKTERKRRFMVCWLKLKLTPDWPLPIESWPPGQHGKISSDTVFFFCFFFWNVRGKWKNMSSYPSWWIWSVLRGENDTCFHQGDGCLCFIGLSTRWVTTSDQYCDMRWSTSKPWFLCPNNSVGVIAMEGRFREKKITIEDQIGFCVLV